MWFTETAWPPIIILMMSAAVMLALWSTSRRAINLIAAVLLLLCCGVVYVIEQQIVTERERVEAAVHDMAAAFESADTGATLEFISPRAFDLQLAVQIAMGAMEIRVRDDLRITDVSVEMLNEESRAKVHLRANGTFYVAEYGDVGHQPTRWNITWQKEGGEWKVIDVERLDPVRGDSIPLLP